MAHLTSEQFVDLAESGRAELSASSASHLASCGECQHQLADLRATMSAAAEVDVPEPSPLFWDRFSARVRDAVEAEPSMTPRSFERWPWLRARNFWVGATVAAALALVVALRVDWKSGPALLPPGTTATAVEAAVEALGAADDPSWSLVADLVADLDWEAASEAGFTMHVGVDNDAVNQLTDSERVELHRLLKGALARPGA